MSKLIAQHPNPSLAECEALLSFETISDNKTIKMVAVGSANSQRLRHQRGTRHRNGPNGLNGPKKIKTIKMVAAGSANSQRPKQQRDARHRNGLTGPNGPNTPKRIELSTGFSD